MIKRDQQHVLTEACVLLDCSRALEQQRAWQNSNGDSKKPKRPLCLGFCAQQMCCLDMDLKE